MASVVILHKILCPDVYIVHKYREIKATINSNCLNCKGSILIRVGVSEIIRIRKRTKKRLI